MVERLAPHGSAERRSAASVHRLDGRFVAGTVLISVLLLSGPLFAVSPAPGAPSAADRGEAPRFSRSLASVAVPAVGLVDQEGRNVQLDELLDPRQPVVVNFFFASCGSICPVMTASLSAMREALGREGLDVRTVSITIDPDQDSPEVLKSYARRFSAGPGWSFLTGDAGTVASIQKAFGAETGGKFNHKALYFFHSAGTGPWVRIEGLAGASDLAKEARGALQGARAGR